uniref:Sec-independent protein translocase protein TatC n=1 Tax=Candidatus Kentrum sp. LFY TaxID=2126342 RepID=A0A450U578_9GAMM|nr:MAG: sec-independent protein translocase protein TatC [Candidatus Kentron sp. LFY]
MRSTSSPQGEMPFLAHLVELRDRLLRSLLAVIVVLLALIPFANDLYEWLSAPLLKYLPQGTSMIATEVASPFFAPFKLAIVTAIFITMPVIVYQLWAFVAPGLYKKEKKLAYPLMITSTVLFYLGAAFAYFAVFPLVFGFFTSVAPEGVEVATDISKYLDFVLKLFFAFGLAFEVPVATILLVSGGFTTPEALVSKRPYVIVVAFIIGMLLTPPDVISQTLLALPMWILFELGVFFSRMYTVGKEKPSEAPPERYRYSPVTEEELDRAMGEGLDEALSDVDPGRAEDQEKASKS